MYVCGKMYVGKCMWENVCIMYRGADKQRVAIFTFFTLYIHTFFTYIRTFFTYYKYTHFFFISIHTFSPYIHTFITYIFAHIRQDKGRPAQTACGVVKTERLRGLRRSTRRYIRNVALNQARLRYAVVCRSCVGRVSTSAR